MRAALAVVLLLGLCAPASADGIESVLGAWVSEDGITKTDFVREFDGSWVTTHMWFKVENEWQLVATGAMYQRPGEETWRMVGRTRDMGAIVLFESEFEFADDGIVKVSYKAFNTDGTTRIAVEDWQVSENEIVFDIFDIKDGERVPLFSGKWLRADQD